MEMMVLEMSIPKAESYVNSHTTPGRGLAYDDYYASDPEVQYLWAQERRVLTQMLGDFYANRPVHLLDFACGTGRITSFLEDWVESSCGVDVSESMLMEARKKLARTALLKVNLLEECPFARKSFNLITAFRFFLNAEPGLRRAALNALAPLLAEDGCFVFNIHRNRYSFHHWLTGFYCRVRHCPPERTLSIGECDRLLAQVGWEICRVYSVGLLHIPKLRFSDGARERGDQLGLRWKALGRFSDSPIIVARKKG